LSSLLLFKKTHPLLGLKTPEKEASQNKEEASEDHMFWRNPDRGNRPACTSPQGAEGWGMS